MSSLSFASRAAFMAATTVSRQSTVATIGFQSRRVFSTALEEEIKSLELLLQQAKERQGGEAAPAEESFDGKTFNIGTFNAISPEGLDKFTNKYQIHKLEDDKETETHAILLRSHKIKTEEVATSVRAIARCGAGTNNIPVDEMTKRGIPVFNTPGANANSVKELTLCALLLASRGVYQGINHMKTIFAEDGDDIAKVKKRVESEKKLFVGREIMGKKLGVVGMGHIGRAVANSAAALGMDVVGYDPAIDIETAWNLPGELISRASSLDELLETSDYISLHVPYMKETHHLIGRAQLEKMKPNASIVNFARGELVDSESMRALLDSGARTGKYVADFADEALHDHPNVILIPHLGASTAEAEANSASMAAEQIMDFIETGNIRNSVNFPTVRLPSLDGSSSRLCIVNKNIPGMLGVITSTVGSLGLNIRQQVNASRGDIAYTIVDLDTIPDDQTVNDIQEAVGSLTGVISSRFFLPTPVPAFFEVNEIE